MNQRADQGLRSAAFECTVRHERFLPRRHRFAYRLFYLAVDLDELATLNRRLRLLGVNRRGWLSLWERDYLPTHEPLHNRSVGGEAHRSPDSQPSPAVAPRLAAASTPPSRDTAVATSLKARVVAWCVERGVDPGPDARVVLVTLPRMFGYAFNPVSFYFCFDRAGQPRAAIAEVTNTFREVKPYLVPIHRTARDAAGVFRVRVPKHFYVSPFSDVDVAFDFTLRAPDARLAMQIDDYAGAQRTLHSTLTGRRVALTDARLAWLVVKHPLVTLRVIGLIHWEALRLWSKGMPWFRKAAGADRQQDLHRPHASLLPRPT